MSTNGTMRVSTKLNKDSNGRPISPKFIGKLQQTRSRLTAKPMVAYDKGGCDFRTYDGSCFGRQLQGLNHTRSASKVSLGTASRFTPSHTVGPGPSLPAVSSIGKQTLSRRSTAGTMSFGTSTRNGALKLYATYTAKK